MERSRPPDLVPGQRLKTFASRWKDFHTSPIIKKLVKFGYRMKFDHTPKLSVPREKFATHLPKEQMDVIRSSVAEFLEKKAVRKISYKEACQNPGFYSKLFAVPKPNGTWRMIIDMRRLNSHISKKRFKMQGIKDVRNALKKNMYGAVIDISDAYYHVSMHKRSRKYTRFMLDGEIYEYLGLPMGLTCSPRIFTKVSKAVVTVLRLKGVIIIIYIDDILVLGMTFEECSKNVKMVLDLLSHLGFIIRPEKCTLTPATRFVYLGCVWDTASWRVGVKEKREKAIRKAATVVIKSEAVTVRTFSRLLGKIRSTDGFLPLARARSRAMGFDFSAVCKSKEDYSKKFVPSEHARAELKYWATLPEGESCLISTIDMPVHSVDTDASPDGYGWYWQQKLFSESFTGKWKDLHINVKELYALRQFLRGNIDFLEKGLVCWRVDNSSALAAIKK